jgi:S-adenosylmethionine:tRNA ribosyltransferase-isomerase
VTTVDFALPAHLEAHEPPEARGVPRDGVRLLVGYRSSGTVLHRRFTDLPDLLRTGDLLVVNTSGTLPAALSTVDGPVVHVSTELPNGDWVVELRRALEPYRGGAPGTSLRLHGGATVTLVDAYSPGRLWRARIDVPDVPAYLRRYGRAIRYRHVPRDWPIEAYTTVFATEPGSAEMPSAGRPFSPELVTRLVARGVLVAPILLHTGVASPEAHEKPYPERYAVSAATARAVNATRAGGGRVVAVGTTVVRALETATGADGTTREARGWTDLVVTPARGIHAVDGLLTGFHEPRASHLDLLAAVAGRDLLGRCYAEALAAGYLWHEFGDVNLLLP